jgi:hypothetical protein
MMATQDVINSTVAGLQAIIDAGEASTAALRAQLTTAMATVKNLREQLAAAEGSDVQAARQALALLKQQLQQPAGRRTGLHAHGPSGASGPSGPTGA